MARAHLQTLIPPEWDNLNFSVPREQTQHLWVGAVLDRSGSRWQVTHLDEDYITPENVIVRMDRL